MCRSFLTTTSSKVETLITKPNIMITYCLTAFPLTPNTWLWLTLNPDFVLNCVLRQHVWTLKRGFRSIWLVLYLFNFSPFIVIVFSFYSFRLFPIAYTSSRWNGRLTALAAYTGSTSNYRPTGWPKSKLQTFVHFRCQILTDFQKEIHRHTLWKLENL